MSVSIEARVGRLAAEHPAATRVFDRHGIDYCCGGGRPLRAVCEAKGLDPVRLMEEIRTELQRLDGPSEDWDAAPLPGLIEHILREYHAPLREELPRLEAMARKVRDVHGAKDPAGFAKLLSVYLGLEAELEAHMLKEEQILFPLIERGQGKAAGAPISVMEHEHATAASGLRRLRELTNDYEAPAGACNTWRALWHGLAELEDSLHRHIHLENNILFPRALAG
jgi:regulator of cell morphogenesis and NO signaling